MLRVVRHFSASRLWTASYVHSARLTCRATISSPNVVSSMATRRGFASSDDPNNTDATADEDGADEAENRGGLRSTNDIKNNIASIIDANAPPFKE